MSGSAIRVISSVDHPSNTSIINNRFQNNAASSEGGAIYYNYNRPSMSSNIFINNSALYGENVASYPTKIVLNSTKQESLNLENVGSGLKYEGDLIFALVDQDDQTMILDNSSTLKLTPMSPNASLTGIDFAKVTAGVAKFSSIAFNSYPGERDIKFRITSGMIDSHFDLTVSFRFCKPGEFEETDGKCSICPYESFTLLWNQTQCQK
jgi:hypothetical protein